MAILAVLATAALTFQALREPGFPQTPPAPIDRSTWIAHDDRSLVGRVNPTSAQLDSALVVEGDVRLIQDPTTGAVVLLDETADELVAVDRVLVTAGSRFAAPEGATVLANGATLAVSDPADGRIWTATVADPSAADARTAPPRATVGTRPALAVTAAGVVHATAAGSAQLVRVDPDGSSVTSALPGGPVTEPQVTAVGEEPVVFDARDGSLRVGDRQLTPPGLRSGLVQLPGPAADRIVVATPTGTVAVALADGSVERLDDRGPAGAAPVVTTAGCVVTVAAGTGTTTCPGAEPVSVDLGDREVEVRGRGADVVVNDARSGAAWLATDGFREITGWEQVAPPEVADPNRSDDITEADPDRVPPPPPDCAGVPLGTPRAQDDGFGVRAGRATVLRVLDNDPATDCTAVRISGVSGLPAELGTVVVVDGGSALQITTTPDATGRLPDLEYEVDNGRGATASATVVVEVAAPSVRADPQRIRPSATEVEAGGTTTYDVLADWVSPTGDDLYLVSATADSGDEISMRQDGTVTFRSTGRGAGTQVPVQVVVSDGTAQVAGLLTVAVAEPGSTTPISHPLQVTATVGRPVTLDPRRTLSAGTVRPLRITGVQPFPDSTGASATVDPAGGRIVVRSSTVGTFYFTFGAAAGDRTTTGVLRADVLAAGAGASVVPMVDVALLPEGAGLLLDPLANDADPGGRGLAVQRVSAPSSVSGGVTAAVVDLHQVDLAARSLSEPVTLDYHVWDGGTLAVGQIRVVPVPAVKDPPQPLAPPIAVVVRAGDVVTVPLAEHATSQDGSALTVALDGEEVDRVPGVLFSTATSIRYLAPAEPPPAPVVFGYTVTAATSTPSTSTSVSTPPIPTATGSRRSPWCRRRPRSVSPSCPDRPRCVTPPWVSPGWTSCSTCSPTRPGSPRPGRPGC